MIWSFVLTGVGITALWLVGKKIIWGWVVGMALQFLWFAYAILTEQWGFLISCVLYGYVNAKNYFEWKKDERKDLGSHSYERTTVRT